MPADPSTSAAPAATTRLGIDLRHLPWVRPLAGEYAHHYSRIGSLYAGDPRSDDAWREAVSRVQRRDRHGHPVADALARQQAHRGAPPAAREAARRLDAPSTVAIVTGQQAGVFGGPLYTVLKAVTAIQLARHVEASLGVAAVPVFWVDAEDHDWDEIASCAVLDAQLEPRTVTLAAPDGAGERPIAALRLDDRVAEAIGELERTLDRGDFTRWTVDALRDAYRPGAGMADAFARLIEGLLGAHGLVVFDSSDASLKPLVADLFRREIETPGRTASLAARAGEAFAAIGHAPQVTPQADSVALFRIDGARRPIRRHGDRYLAGEEAVDAAALAGEISGHPDRFSPNVLLRPLVQDTLFPTVCYVAGPSELAYLGQLKEVYAHFGVPMPLVHPRASATLVDSATARFLRKYDLPIHELQVRDESALNRLLQSQLPPEVEAGMHSAEASVRGAMQQLIEVLPLVDPTLAGAARTTLGRMEHELRTLHSKLIGAAKRRDETLRRQFTRAQAQMFPGGQPQERALGVAYFLNLYGPALVERLLQDLPSEMGHHWVLAI